MFNKKFVTIGTGKVLDINYKENNICSRYSQKPVKGLWASLYNETGESLSDWEDFYYEDDEKILDYSIFKLKKDAKIMVLDKKEDVYKYPGYVLEKELDDLILKANKKLISFGIPNENIIKDTKKYGKYRGIDFQIFNMNSILSNYDGIYVSDNFISETREIYYHWSNWDVNTLVLFNIDCIDIVEEVANSIKDKQKHIATLDVSNTDKWLCHMCTCINIGQDNNEYKCSICNYNSNDVEKIYDYSFWCPECGHKNIGNKISSIKRCNKCNTSILMNEINYIKNR